MKQTKWNRSAKVTVALALAAAAGAGWIWGAKPSDSNSRGYVLFCFKSEPGRFNFKKSRKAKLRGFEGGSGLIRSLKQLMWKWFQASQLRRGWWGVSTFCLLPLHFRACTLLGPLCTSIHTPFASPTLLWAQKGHCFTQDWPKPQTHFKSWASPSTYCPPTRVLRTPIKFEKFLWEEFIWLQNCPVCFWKALLTQH